MTHSLKWIVLLVIHWQRMLCKHKFFVQTTPYISFESFSDWVQLPFELLLGGYGMLKWLCQCGHT